MHRQHETKSAVIPKGTAQALSGLLVAIVGLTYFALVVLERVKYPVAELYRSGVSRSELLRAAVVLVHWWEWVVLVLVLGGLALAGVLETRRHAVSNMLASKPSWPATALFVALILWFGHGYLVPGYLLGGDATAFVEVAGHFAEGLVQGGFPIWDNYSYLGAPFVQFGAPLYFWTSGVLSYLVGDANVGTKLVLLASHAGGCVLFYRLLRAYGLGTFGAWIGAIAYTGAFAHVHLFLWKGIFTQAVTVVLLPLAFLLLDRVMMGFGTFGPVWAAMTAVNALLIVNHPTTGMAAWIYLMLYGLVTMISGRAPWSRLRVLVPSVVLSTLMTLFMVIPVLTERQWVMMYETPTLLRWVWPNLDYLKALVLWRNTGMPAGTGTAAYLGLSVWVLAALGLWGALRSRTEGVDRRIVFFMAAAFVLSLGMRTPHLKEVVFNLFFLAFLAGLGAQAVLSRWGAGGHAPALVLVTIMLDLGLTAVQPVARTDKAYFEVGGRYLLPTGSSERVIHSYTGKGQTTVSIGTGGPPLHYFPLQQVTGALGLEATVSHSYSSTVVKMVEAELRATGCLSDRTEKLTGLLNVGRIINDTGTGWGFPAGKPCVTEDGPLNGVIRPRFSTPVVFSTRLSRLDPGPGLDKPFLWNESFTDPADRARVEQLEGFLSAWMDALRFAPETRSAQAIPVRESPENAETASGVDPGEWKGRIEHYEVKMQSIRLKVSSELPGYLQLSHPWYPFLRVAWNGREISPLRGSINLMVVPVKAGMNEYEIVPVLSPLRQRLFIVALVVLLAMVLMGAAAGVRRLRGVSGRARY